MHGRLRALGFKGCGRSGFGFTFCFSVLGFGYFGCIDHYIGCYELCPRFCDPRHRKKYIKSKPSPIVS